MVSRDEHLGDAMKDMARDTRDSVESAADRVAGRTSNAARDVTDRDGISHETGNLVGEGVGGVSGIAAGAAIGSLGGPVGTIIGAIAGAVGGWWAGRAVSEAAASYTDEDDAYYRSHFASKTRGSRTSYETARPGYQLGQLAARNPDYAGRSFNEVEPDLKRGWSDDMRSKYGNWNDVRDYVGSAYDRGREQRLTLSEEQVAIGKREVQAGEVALRKTVETEHVRESVPLMREEVTVERHAVDAGSYSGDVEIGEQEIRIPITEEEAVVQKRAVVKEEIVARKRAVEETEQIEADLRRERLNVDRNVDRDASRTRTTTDDDQRPT